MDESRQIGASVSGKPSERALFNQITDPLSA